MGLRPARYSWPNFLGLILAGIIYSWLRSSAIPERGLLAYAVVLLVLGGATTANWLWAHAAASRSGDIGGH